MVVPLDSALNIAFPAMTAHFGLALPEIQWIVICYVLTYGSLMLGIGRLGDIFGHARVFRAGLAWSALAYLLCAWAPGYGWLLACRVMQGIGAALVISCGPALVTGWFAEALRPRVLGLYTLMFAAGSVLGPSLGGLLVAWFGWEAVFWFRTPIALAALLLLRGAAAPAPGVREPFDLPGAALLALAIGSLLLAINRLGSGGLVALPLGLAVPRRALGLPAAEPAECAAGDRAALFPPAGLRRAEPGQCAGQHGGLRRAALRALLPHPDRRLAGGVAGLVLAASPAGAMLVSAPGGWLLGRLPARRMAACGPHAGRGRPWADGALGAR